MNPGAPIRGRRYRARGEDWTVGSLGDQSRRISWCGDRQRGQQDQRSLLAQRTSSNIDAGEFKHQLVN